MIITSALNLYRSRSRSSKTNVWFKDVLPVDLDLVSIIKVKKITRSRFRSKSRSRFRSRLGLYIPNTIGEARGGVA